MRLPTRQDGVENRDKVYSWEKWFLKLKVETVWPSSLPFLKKPLI